MVGENRGPVIVGVFTLCLILSCAVVFGRVVTRTVVRPQFGIDDSLIVITLFIYIGFIVSEFVAVSHGYGRPFAALNPDSARAALRASTVAQVLAVWTYPTGKAAVACLLMRLFPGKMLKWILWILVALNAIFFTLNGIFLLAQCSPVAYQWDRTIPGGSCWQSMFLEDWGYATGSIGAATDLAFAIVPWFYITRLQMSLRQKLLIGAALSTGLVPFICAILKIRYTADLGVDADPTYALVDLFLTGASELCAINIAACVPTLAPLYLWCRRKQPRTPYHVTPQGRGRSDCEGNPGRFGRRFNQTPTEILLHSCDSQSDSKLQFGGQTIHIGGARDDTSQEGRTGSIASGVA